MTDAVQMDEGLEIDSQVAERVMGWRRVGYLSWQAPGNEGRGWEYLWPGPPHFSTDISAAWLVVERMLDLGFSHPMVRYDSDRDFEHWTAAFGSSRGDGETAPLAICRAALAALATPKSIPAVTEGVQETSVPGEGAP